MKYTTKRGLELPPEVVEVIENLKNEFGVKKCYIWEIDWNSLTTKQYQALDNIRLKDDFTEFYKLYPKKDLDSYGNEIHKGEIVEVRDTENRDWIKGEFVAFCEKRQGPFKYVVYDQDYATVMTYKFCRKINSNEVKKSELQSQMEDLKAQVKEIEAKINEL